MKPRGTKVSRSWVNHFKLQKSKQEIFDNGESHSISKNRPRKENSKTLWSSCKPYLTNKHPKGDSDILLIENNNILLGNCIVANIFNNYFQSFAKDLDLFEGPYDQNSQENTLTRVSFLIKL